EGGGGARFQEDRAEIPGLGCHPPQPFGGAPIGPQNNGASSVAHYVRKGRDHVVYGNRSDPQTIGFHGHLGLERTEGQEWVQVPRERDKVRPDDIIKNVLLHAIKCFLTSVNTRAILGGSPSVLNENRQSRRVVGVRMRKEHMPDGFLILRSAVKPQATPTNSHGSVDQITTDVLAPGGISH